MFKKSLKLKLVAGALGLILAVCVANTVVVSVIVNRQNRAAVGKSLENAMSIVRDDLYERQNRVKAEITQMMAANKIGPMVKFFAEFAQDELSISHSNYIAVAGTLLNQTRSSRLASLGIYDADGHLQTFAVRKDDAAFRFGFQHQGILYYSDSGNKADSAEDEWHQTQNRQEFKMQEKLTGTSPEAEVIRFESIGGKIAIRIRIPVVAVDYDDNGDEVIKRFGTLDALQMLQGEVVARLSRLTGMPINVYSSNRFSIGDISAMETIDPALLPKPAEGDWNIEAQAASPASEMALQDQKYFRSVLPIYEGSLYVGAVMVMQPDDVVRANNRQMITILCVAALICVLLCTPLAIMFSGSTVRQITGVVSRLKDIAQGDGDLTRRLEVKSSDEIGQLARWFNSFMDNIHGIVSEIKENSEKLSSSSSELSNIAQMMAHGSAQTTAKADAVAGSGSRMSANMKRAATTMEGAAQKVQIVAAAVEELNATISQITQNTGEACEITSHAVDQAQNATRQVSELGNAASEIGKVIDAITDISDQVNLLALNATIEAARAGDAGKGFAVVANEIKELARQTAAATDEIRSNVESIQSSTQGTVDEIASITSVVGKVNDIVSSIANAVEEQSATTGSIAENIHQTADGIGEVNRNVSESSSVAVEIAGQIDEVNQASGEISGNSSQVQLNAKELSALSDKLKGMVNQFKI